ncbi:hypothetical protein BpHYR1_004071 [Brachionus plicatilis]|uniref:Uncharacterized protein n=1 Tax=Brachionus plicatilis TaxID=10195 RepID=A0A3M7PSN9_BRAPC|nr:hypothetical protein BpHYR1_004071 [Brachionus plicatilis]
MPIGHKKNQHYEKSKILLNCCGTRIFAIKYIYKFLSERLMTVAFGYIKYCGYLDRNSNFDSSPKALIF